MERPSANDLYKAAQRLLKVGQPVFPCRAETVDDRRKAKAPLTRNGLYDATANKAQVRAWLERHGENMALGIPTGKVWDVLDVDTKGEIDGRIHLPRLHRLGILDGCKFVVRTPSHGWHLYFLASRDVSNKVRSTMGLDVRGTGGYVLAPPSYIDDAENSVGVYEHMGETEGSTDEPLLWDLITQTLAPVNADTNKPLDLLGYERQASLASLRGWLSERTTGERNNALHWATSRCVENGLDPYELMEVALLIGLGEEEAELTMNSVMKRAGVTRDSLRTEAEVMFPGV